MKTRKFTLGFVIILIIQVFTASYAGAATVGDKYISSQGACVMDFETGEILYEHNGYIRRSPASMTKVMSLYCIYSELEKRSITLDTPVPISRRVYDLPVVTDYQCIPLYYNSTYTVDDLIGAVATYSASNALLALVEFVSGTEAEFVKLMNKTASEIGIDATYYDSCGGYTNAISPVSMAHLAKRIITDYPDILARTSKKYIVFNGVKYYSTNKLYSTYYYPGIDGLKTGTSSTAGCCLCATGVKDGRRIITVTMNSISNDYRFKDSINLLDFGFEELAKIYSEKLYYTKTRAFLNGEEIPLLNYVKGNEIKPVIILENLSCYGFDVSYNIDTNTMKLTLNPQKEITPVSCDSFIGDYGVRYTQMSFKQNDGIKVIISDGKEEHIIENVFLTNEGCLVSLEEFGQNYNLYWDEESVSYNISYPNSKRQNNPKGIAQYIVSFVKFKTE